jgi:hypothetical protein
MAATHAEVYTILVLPRVEYVLQHQWVQLAACAPPAYVSGAACSAMLHIQCGHPMLRLMVGLTVIFKLVLWRVGAR